MENLHTRLGYLRGLAEGLGVSEETKEGKVISQIIAVLDDIANTVEELREDYEELFSYVEAIDEDLTGLENELMEEEDLLPDIEEDFEDEFETDDFDISFTVECPECRQEVPIDDDILEDEESMEVLCPSCGKVIFINDEGWEGEELELEEGDEEREKEE